MVRTNPVMQIPRTATQYAHEALKNEGVKRAMIGLISALEAMDSPLRLMKVELELIPPPPRPNAKVGEFFGIEVYAR